MSIAFRIIVSTGLAVSVAAAQPSDNSKLHNGLGAAVRALEPGELLPVVIVMREQTPQAQIDALAEIDDKGVRRDAVLGALKETAARTQGGVLDVLRNAQQTGGVGERLRPLWIANMIAVDASPAVIARIAARGDVDYIHYDKEIGEEVFPVLPDDGDEILAGGGGFASAVAADDKLLFGDIPDWCGYMSPQEWQGELWAAVARGEIENPVTKARPAAGPPNPAVPGNPSCVTPAQFFAYEDTAGVLSGPFSIGAMLALMTDAANALLAEHGDNYDFVGYWTNFDPHHLVGAAFYLGIENDVSGIGQIAFNNRVGMGLNGDNIEGYVMMWNLNTSWWEPGDGPNAKFTRLVLAQEFEHRFGMFLPETNGLELQGNNGNCGRVAHWNFRVDGQGSGMEIAEWVGVNPAVRNGDPLNFNTDIADSVWSYTDLYLMGYVSPSEMDAGNSELRYMVNSACTTPYSGTIVNFTSSDIVATSGPRIPNSSDAQKHFRTAWIVIHQPGDAPDQIELQRTSAILNQHTTDWDHSTLGLGTIDNTIFDDQNCDGLPDCPADIDGDGDIDMADYFLYVDAFVLGDLTICDIDGDGDCDAEDFFGYLDQWVDCY